MNKKIVSVAIAAIMGTVMSPAMADSPASPEEELAYNIGMQAFIYGVGPLTVAAVRHTSINVEAPLDNGMAPLNQMGKTRVLSGPQDRIVPTLNNDHLYSQAHYDLDMTGPMVLEIPKTDSRYYIVQLLDAYSESITDLHRKNAGENGAKYLLVKKGWSGEVPEGIGGVIESRTPMAWLIHRTGVAGQQDTEAAVKVHERFISYPLTELGKEHGPIELKTAKNRIPPMTKPKGLEWYALIDRELRKNPIVEDAAIVDQFEYIGIGGEQPFNPDNLSEAQKRGLLRALKSSQQIIQYAGRNVGTTNNGWSMMYEGGRYGTDYLSRASINMRAAGLNVPERALYPNRYTDSEGLQLSGDYKYRMTMPADAPAEAFWSLTMYDAKDLYMVENEINRYAVSTNRPQELTYNADGTLTVCIQNQKPTESNCNWLPAPEDDFYLHMRLYEPTQAVLENEYPLPQVIKQ